MANVLEMLNRAQVLDIAGAVNKIIDTHIDDLPAYNKAQLMKGQDSKGQLLSPRHSENPFFKKPGAGLRYAEWKQKLFPETPFDVPNLIVTGPYHNSISFERAGNNLNAQASISFADSIDQTFGQQVLGLDQESAATFKQSVIMPELRADVKSELGL